MQKQFDKNIYFLTGVGQLRNISGFINQYKATNNVAVILYTEQNLAVVDHILQNIDKDLFIDVQYEKIPTKILEEKLSKSKDIYHTLERVINDNIEKYGIKNTFLCNMDNYYYFIKRITKNLTTLNLLEEGLTTYRVYLEYQEQLNYKVSIKDVLKKIKVVLKRTYIAFRPFINIIKSLAVLILTILSFITRCNLLYRIKKTIKGLKKYKYNLITKFDNIYVCYPELMKRLNPKNKNIQELKLNYNDDDFVFTRKKDKENILFINQKYGIRYKEHFVIIFSILRDMGIKKIYIKFHPRENIEDFKEIYDYSKSLYPDIEIITLEGAEHIPVENLINKNNITKIIGLTTSSLFYSKLVKESLETISIAKEYKKRCEDLKVNKKRMKMFSNDYNMFCKLFNVEQYEYDGNELEGKNE